MDNQQVMDFVT